MILLSSDGKKIKCTCNAIIKYSSFIREMVEDDENNDEIVEICPVPRVNYKNLSLIVKWIEFHFEHWLQYPSYHEIAFDKYIHNIMTDKDILLNYNKSFVYEIMRLPKVHKFSRDDKRKNAYFELKLDFSKVGHFELLILRLRLLMEFIKVHNIIKRTFLLYNRRAAGQFSLIDFSRF